MKKNNTLWKIIAIVMIVGFSLMACEDGSEIVTQKATQRYRTVPLLNSARSVVEDNNGLIYSAHDKDNDLYYYVFLLGHIDLVPIASRQAVIYDGITPVSIGYSSTTTNAVTITEGMESAIQYGFTKKQEVGFKIGFQAGPEWLQFSTELSGSMGWEEMNGRSLTNTFETAVSKGIETNDSISVTIGEHNQQSGKYRYSLFCTTDVYYVMIIEAGEEDVRQAYYAVCARPDSYAWGIDYEPDLGGNFGKTAPGQLLETPDIELSLLPVPTNKFEEDKLPTKQRADMPIANLKTGNYIGQQTVSLTTTTPGASIYYTINGGPPSADSNLYTNPITISGNGNNILRAIAIASDPGIDPSEIMTETYHISASVEYIKQIYIGHNSDRTNALNHLRGQTQTSENLIVIEKDLNEGAGGQFIFMGYTTTSNPDEAIRGLMIDNTKNNPPSISGWTQIGPDLNVGASGDYLWLYATRSGEGAPLSNLFVQINETPPSDSGWTCVQLRSGGNADLNKGAGGKFIYLWMQQ